MDPAKRRDLLRQQAAEQAAAARDAIDAAEKKLEQLDEEIAKLNDKGELNDDEKKALNSHLEARKQINKELADAIKKGEKAAAIAEKTTQSYERMLTSIASQSAGLQNLQGIQQSIAALDSDRLQMQMQLGAAGMDENRAQQFDDLQSIAQQISSLNADDAVGREALLKKYRLQLEALGAIKEDEQAILNNINQQVDVATQIAKLTKETQTILNAQRAEYDAITSGLATAMSHVRITFSSFGQFFGAVFKGIGALSDKLADVNRKFGTSFLTLSMAKLETAGLSFFFENAAESALALTNKLGSASKLTLGMKIDANVIADNLGITAEESATLINAFGNLSGQTHDVAMNMIESTRQTAEMAGVAPGEVMRDIAQNAEFTALATDGTGKNIAKAAIQAKQLGVNLATVSKIQSSLLDFETSINAELEASALLGRDINMQKARELMAMGKMDEANAEILSQLGGIEEFNEMDYWQRDAIAKMLGVEVSELQSMMANQDNLNKSSGFMMDTYSRTQAIIEDIAASSLGKVTGGIGTLLQNTGQFARDFKDTKDAIGGIGSGIKGFMGGMKEGGGFLGGLKNMFGGGAPNIPTTPLADGGALPDMQMPGSDKIGDKLGSLAEGLEKMGTGKVTLGALNLIPTGIGFLFMTPGLIGLWGVSTFGEKAGQGLMNLAIGLEFMGSGKVFLGALALAVAGLGFAVATIGLPAMMVIALLGTAIGAGLTGIAIGMEALGSAAASGVAFLGLALLAGFGASLIPLTYALSLLAPLIEAVGNVIVNVIGAIASGIQTIIGSLSSFFSQILPMITMESAFALFAMGYGFYFLATSLIAFAASALMALPALLAVGTFLSLGGGELLKNMGGEEGGGEKEEKMSLTDVVNSINGLRTELMNKQIVVQLDGRAIYKNTAWQNSQTPISNPTT